jgi:hypothetical protein
MMRINHNFDDILIIDAHIRLAPLVAAPIKPTANQNNPDQ